MVTEVQKMKTIDLYKNFNLKYINSLAQYWKNTRAFRCIGKPKNQDLLLYLDGLDIVYVKKDGTTVTAHDGDVVYTPVGSEYRASLCNFKREDAHTVGINFLLADEKGEQGVLFDDVTVFRKVSAHLNPLFHRAAVLENSPDLLKKRIMVLEIISSLTEGGGICPERPIEPVVARLTEHPEENLSVAAMAELCGVSQTYFRKLFRAAFGVTPAAFRNTLRLERAAKYLEYGQISVQEISDTLGYATVSHFIKEFRLTYGISPAKYKKAFQNS